LECAVPVWLDQIKSGSALEGFTRQKGEIIWERSKVISCESNSKNGKGVVQIGG
jgi:hypothetical protein